MVLSLLLVGPLACEDEVVEDSIPKADAAADQKTDAPSEGRVDATDQKSDAASEGDSEGDDHAFEAGVLSDTSEGADGAD
jgi:hypothetical protein